MDTTYLDELVKLSDSADKIVAEVHKANKRLRDEYENMEGAALEKFINDMRGLGEYAKKLNNKTFYTDIHLDFERGFSNEYPEIIISFSNSVLQILSSPSGYSFHPSIYDDRYADYDRIESGFKSYMPSQRFEYGWSWEAEKSKRFIALNADKIYNRVYDMICERFAEETKRKIAAARKRSEQLINDIERLEN